MEIEGIHELSHPSKMEEEVYKHIQSASHKGKKCIYEKHQTCEAPNCKLPMCKTCQYGCMFFFGKAVKKVYKGIVGLSILLASNDRGWGTLFGNGSSEGSGSAGSGSGSGSGAGGGGGSGSGG
jgi:uncharacterized membrane protein YgcG